MDYASTTYKSDDSGQIQSGKVNKKSISSEDSGTGNKFSTENPKSKTNNSEIKKGPDKNQNEDDQKKRSVTESKNLSEHSGNEKGAKAYGSTSIKNDPKGKNLSASDGNLANGTINLNLGARPKVFYNKQFRERNGFGENGSGKNELHRNPYDYSRNRTESNGSNGSMKGTTAEKTENTSREVLKEIICSDKTPVKNIGEVRTDIPFTKSNVKEVSKDQHNIYRERKHSHPSNYHVPSNYEHLRHRKGSSENRSDKNEMQRNKYDGKRNRTESNESDGSAKGTAAEKTENTGQKTKKENVYSEMTHIKVSDEVKVDTASAQSKGKEGHKGPHCKQRERKHSHTDYFLAPTNCKEHRLHIILEETVQTGAHLKEFLEYRMGKPRNLHFTIVKMEKIDSSCQKQLIVASFSSVKKRLLAKSLLNKSNRNSQIKILCFDNDDEARGMQTDRTKDKCSFLQDMISAAEKVFKTHDEKLDEVRSKLENVMEKLQAKKGLSLGEFQTLVDERPALEDKLNELTLQRKEFINYIQAMKSKIAEIPDKDYDKQAKKMRIAFGAERKRFETALPMYACREQILNTVKENSVCVVLGETGSGKSTQMVQYLYQAGFAENGQIVCTQPRKIAATSLAQRVASEMGCSVGQETGYRVGMQAKISALTKILFVTDHILLNECLKDEQLSQYSCIIIDEAHERSIFTDLLLGMLKKCLKRRPELRVVVTSATIDPWVFTNYFNDQCKCPVLKVSGRIFPVDVFYTEDDYDTPFPEDYEKKALNKAIELHKDNSVDSGDMLVFLTSPLEAERCCNTFQLNVKTDDFQCLQLHGRLSPEEQQLVFENNKKGKRKIVFATNSAETSVTIPGIRFVIDTGVVKEMQYDAKKNINSLSVVTVSQSSANQRKGRAGRVSVGTCYRLYKEKDFERMDRIGKPEILRIHLGQGLLKLMEMGVNPLSFEFVESPSDAALQSAIETLEEIQAVREGSITELGKWISKLPVDPRLGALVKQGIDAGVPLETLVIAGYNNQRNIFFRVGSEEEKKQSDMRKIKFCHEKGDVFTALNVYKAWDEVKETGKGSWCKTNSVNGKAMKNIREMVKEIMTILQRETDIKIRYAFSNTEDRDVVLQNLIFKTMMQNLCVYLGHEKAGYLTLKRKQHVKIHPSCSLLSLGSQPTWVCFGELLRTSDDFITDVTPVTDEIIDAAVEDSLLKIDKQSFLAQQVKEAKRVPVGNLVFRTFVGPMHKKRRELEEKISNVCNNATIIVDANKTRGEVSLFCLPKFSEIAGEMMKHNIDMISTKLLYSAIEEPVSSNKSAKSIRALICKGGEIRDILMPHHFRTMHVKMKDFCRYDITEDSIMDMLSQYGLIEDLWRPQGRRGQNYQFWGKITFVYKRDAEAALEDMKADEDCDISLVPITFDTEKERQQDYTIKLRWCRRPAKDHCFVYLNHPEDLTAILVSREMIIGGSYMVSISKSKRDSDLMIRGLKSDVTEELVRRGLLNLLDLSEKGNEKRFRIIIPREKVIYSPFETTRIRQQIISRVGRVVEEARVNVEFLNTKDTTVMHTAFVKFIDPTVCEMVTADMRAAGFSINGQSVKFDSLFKGNVFVTRRVFKAVERDVTQFMNTWNSQNTSKAQYRELKSGNFSIDISATSPKEVATLKTSIDEFVDGDIFESGTTKDLDKIFSQNGRAEMQKIENKLRVIITVNERTMKVTVQGLIEDRQKAVAEIADYLEKVASAKDVAIPLKGRSNPPGLLKTLLVKYGIGLKKMATDNALFAIKLNLRDHEITICGFEEGVRKTMENIEDAKKELLEGRSNTEEDEMPDCPVCLCPVEVLDMRRLEYCGHAYCSVCLTSQIQNAIQSKEFPVSCSKEGCGKALVIRDFTEQIRLGLVRRRQLVDATVSNFAAKNKDKYRYCPTPDCNMVYATSVSSTLFACPLCQKRICTKCHKGFHDGMTCEMFESATKDGNSMLKWLKEKPNDRKLCPKCKVGIEKISGCQHMTCKCGAHICWVCMEYFSDSSACYGHLREKHGSFM